MKIALDNSRLLFERIKSTNDECSVKMFFYFLIRVHFKLVTVQTLKENLSVSLKTKFSISIILVQRSFFSLIQ
jgi:hypothetical protein